MENQTKYANLPVADREEHLKANADFAEKTGIKKPFTEDELGEFSRYVVGFLNEIESVEEEITEKVAPLKDKIKELKLRAKEYQTKVRTGYEVEEVQVYGFKDMDAGIVNYYTPEGVFVYSRRLQPAERQATIFRMDSTGTEG